MFKIIGGKETSQHLYGQAADIQLKNADLKDESTIRGLIKEISVLANKQIDKEQEDKLVKKILNDGVNEDLFEMI